MRAKKRIQLKRKPFSDRTNVVVDASSRQNPSPLRQSQSFDIGRCEVSPPSTVYARRRRKAAESEQGNAIGFHLKGYSPIDTIRDFGEQEDEDGSIVLSDLPKVLQRKKQRQALPEQDASKDCLNGYLEQQRVYFEAVDAEELVEEVESDKEDACTEERDNENAVYNLDEVLAE